MHFGGHQSVRVCVCQTELGKKYSLNKFSKFYNMTVKPKIMEKLEGHRKSWHLNISKEQTLIQVKMSIEIKMETLSCFVIFFLQVYFWGYSHALVNLCSGNKVVISSTLHVAFIICKVCFLFLIE